ncbi:SDR family oxidoreductase [Kineosporia mesophila]|uniref:SDR family oxidoreductase n=1 Tax=Kineosporia mesophila TaxID=566012 RepID=A0ABP6Z7L8_9ACTN|nr:SDR family oxidoreductase [Kineosporia mesophila]MCD5352965.1 SDR family oxidoreductase [Kineosporia mesophila]
MTTTALITGANKGIGFETARLLGERGFTVLVGARSEAGEGAARTLRERGLDARSLRIDVTDDASIERARAEVGAEFGRLDVLVNNAGIASSTAVGTRGGPSTATRAAMREIYETNVFGLVAVTNAFLPLLRRADAARIVNVSSQVGSFRSVGTPGESLWYVTTIPYPTSKTAVNMITLMYAKELADTPIKVNSADPGYCSTDLTGRTGERTPEQGALVSVALATLPADGPSGRFFTDGDPTLNEPLPW